MVSSKYVLSSKACLLQKIRLRQVQALFPPAEDLLYIKGFLLVHNPGGVQKHQHIACVEKANSISINFGGLSIIKF